MLESHVYDTKFEGEKDIIAKNVTLIETSTKGKKHIRFAMVSDTQRGYGDMTDFVNHINKCDDIDFIINGGDLTDFGLTQEFSHSRDIHNRLKFPYACVVGNHDFLGTGSYVYREMFGDFDYSFIAGNVLFLCLNTNSMEFNFDFTVPNLDFLRKKIEGLSPETEKTIAVMHAAPNDMTFNQDMASEFHSLLRQFPNLQLCIYGHDHHYRDDDLFGDGIMYIECPTIVRRNYIIFDINEDNTYDYELCQF